MGSKLYEHDAANLMTFSVPLYNASGTLWGILGIGFLQQNLESVLPAAVRARVAVEAAAADYWRKYVGLDGAVLGMTTFGASGPGKALAEHFGFTAAHLADMARQLLG